MHVDVMESLLSGGRVDEEAKPGMEMERSKLDELIGKTAMEVEEEEEERERIN